MKPDLEFNSVEEFRDVCRYLSSRLHQVNRIWLSESGFVWEVAELVERLGSLFPEALADPGTAVRFGDAYRTGELDRSGARERLLEMLAGGSGDADGR